MDESSAVDISEIQAASVFRVEVETGEFGVHIDLFLEEIHGGKRALVPRSGQSWQPTGIVLKRKQQPL